MAWGMTWTEAMTMPCHERLVWEITLGTQRGGVYDFKRKRWLREPPLFPTLFGGGPEPSPARGRRR